MAILLIQTYNPLVKILIDIILSVINYLIFIGLSLVLKLGHQYYPKILNYLILLEYIIYPFLNLFQIAFLFHYSYIIFYMVNVFHHILLIRLILHVDILKTEIILLN